MQDEQARVATLALAEDVGPRWRCPRYCGGAEPAEVEDAIARDVLERVERLTGAQGLRTCPRWYTLQQGVQVACAARQWAERGLLRDRYGEPTLALMQAIECLDGALAARDRDERKRREKKHG